MDVNEEIVEAPKVEESILGTIKKMLGITYDYEQFDVDIIVHINSAFATLETKIAEVVANAPEDFNTLKEISDWITEHADSAAAMNTEINSKYEKPK